jgi:hypothetical protein
MPVKRYPKVPTVDTSTRVLGQVAEPEAECREIGSPARCIEVWHLRAQFVSGTKLSIYAWRSEYA